MYICMLVVFLSHKVKKRFVFYLFIVATHSHPSISNLPASVPIPEDTSVGEILFTVSITDPDLPEEIHVVTMEVSPVEAQSYFKLEPNSN